MKNLKKTLAVVLAFAMILSMGFSAFAYTDVTAGTKVAEAVGILSNLNIFTGFEDGTFKPNDTVTRAQMAAIICRTLGYEDQAVASTGTTNFYDVAASHWASGYINVAESLQIVNGYGNGAFGPEDQVTYEQAIKMIVVALGYELDAQAKGGWSTGYLAVAAREGITKNSNGVVGTPAARGTIAVLVYNSLEVRLMDQWTWTPNGDKDEYGKLDETILSQYLGIRKVEGIVESVPFNDYVAGYTADMDVELTFADGAEYFEYYEGKLEDYALGNLTYNASLVPDANNFGGKKVVAYVGEEQDDETGDYMIYAIAEKQGANKVTVISANQLVDSGAAFTEEGVIAYREIGAKRVSEIDLDTAVLTSGNFGVETATTVSNTSELATFITTDLGATGGIITLISNDANSKVDVILVTAYTSEAVVEEVTNDEGVVMFETYRGTLNDIDTEDEDVLNVVIKDGVVATVADIAANDTVSIVDAGDGSFVVYYVSSKTVTGKVDSYGDDEVEIGGEEYEASPFSAYASDVSGLSGKEGIFFLNVDGQIAHDEATVDKNYAVIIGAGPEGRKNLIEVVLADGTTATYELKDEVEYLNQGKIADTAVITALDTLMVDTDDTNDAQGNPKDNSKDGDWNVAKGADAYTLAFNITVKDGKVRKIESLGTPDNASGRDYDEENMSYGALSFNDSTVIVSVEAGASEKIEADDVKVGKVADYFVDGEGDGYNLYGFDFDNNDIAGLVIGYGLTATVPQDGAAFIFADHRTKIIDDEDAVVINGFQAGKNVSYTIMDEDIPTGVNFNTMAAGSVLLLGVASADGMISDLEVLFNGSAVTAGIADEEDEYYYFGALDESQEPTASKFYLTSPVDETYSGDGTANDYVALDGVTMRNSANYTLVDFSEDSDPEISRKSKGTGLFSRYDKYNYNVFVRYFEDAQVEVIVYKYNKSTVATPVISINNAGSVTITCATEAPVNIVYTVDGGAETPYSSSFTVTDGQVVKAWATKTGYIDSKVATKKYVYVAPAVPTP